MPKPTLTQRIRQAVARWAVGPRPQGQRLYASARNTNGTFGFGSSSGSADAELKSSLTQLRNRSRQMVRDSGYAKRAQQIVVNNVVGTGVGMQAQVLGVRGELNTRVNDDIERAWREWSRADHCHTGGVLAFGELERAAMGEVFSAGEVFIRLHPLRFGRSAVPLALEVIEAERLADNIDMPGMAAGNEFRMGVEVDQYQRPVAYWMRQRHSGDIHLGVRTDRMERVPASEVLHLRVTTRWPQTRGEPWMHTVLRKLDSLAEYSQLEVDAARANAMLFATLENPDGAPPDATDASGAFAQQMEPLSILGLQPGEKLNVHDPSRPNVAFDAFVRAMLREVAAGVGTSYESLSRDYSQSNYSSSRLSLLDDRDGYKALQQWWARSFREPLHRLWLQQAVLARAVPSVPVDAYAYDAARYEAVLWKFRGWSWVDPTKEVNAYKEAVKAGFTTITDVIAQTAGGMDIEDVISTRKRELQMLEEAGIDVDTTVEEPQEPVAPVAQVAEPEEQDEPEDEAQARVMPLRKTA